mmetsp:Transcript_30647/g.55096  ORF Transcript_30647/g.55096 Transcript_30647/m.55096 type:complete len:247 (-) Transcript_30647:698-1438(-)
MDAWVHETWTWPPPSRKAGKRSGVASYEGEGAAVADRSDLCLPHLKGGPCRRGTRPSGVRAVYVHHGGRGGRGNLHGGQSADVHGQDLQTGAVAADDRHEPKQVLRVLRWALPLQLLVSTGEDAAQQLQTQRRHGLVLRLLGVVDQPGNHTANLLAVNHTLVVHLRHDVEGPDLLGAGHALDLLVRNGLTEGGQQERVDQLEHVGVQRGLLGGLGGLEEPAAQLDVQGGHLPRLPDGLVEHQGHHL